MMLRKPAFWIVAFVWLYLMTGLALLMPPPVISDALVGSDDYMRMVRVFDWLNGHRDYEFTQPRLGPLGGAGVAWSRLVDMPLIGLMLVFEPVMGRYPAAMVTATIYPALMLLVFIGAVYWFARQGLPSRAALFGPPALVLLWACATQFYPGRVDHHVWQLILLALAGGFVMRGIALPEEWRGGAGAGALMALGFAIGAEIVPWVAALTALQGLVWVYEGGAMRRQGLAYGLFLAIGTVLLTLLSRKPEFYLAVECDAISLSYVLLAAAVAAYWGIVSLVPERILTSAWARLLAGALVAAPLLAVIFSVMPQCFLDPYGVSAELYSIWVSRVNEARSALSFLFGKNPGVFVFYSGPYVLAALASLWAWKREPERRAVWAAFGAVMIAGLLLSFWQVRVTYIGHALAVLPLAWGMERTFFTGKNWVIANIRLSRKVRLLLELAFLAAAIAFFAYAMPRGGQTVKQRQNQVAATAVSCDYRLVSAALNDMDADPSLTIAAHISGGAEMLFRTPYRVLAASYHRDEEGILAAHHLLMAGDEEAAHALAVRYDVGALVVCEEDLPYWREIAASGDTPLALQLWGGAVPSWLSLYREGPGFRIFRRSETG